MADLTALADPTDFGNKPGDGPLRVGGRAVAPARDANSPATYSPRASVQQPALELVRDLWSGVDQLRTKTVSYLPKAPGEHVEDYNNRVRRTAFFNAFRRTVEGLAGLVFNKDPELGEDVPAPIVEHWENIDLAGTHGDVFVRERFEDALQAGHCAILVDFPRVDGRQTAADEMSGRLRPYWVPIRKEDIMSWRTENIDGRTVLMQLVVRETHYMPDGEFGEKKTERYRVFQRSEGQISWQLLRVDESNKVIREEAGTYTNQEEIPVAEIGSSGRMSLFESDPPLKDLAHLNVAHFQMWSDYNWSIHKTCVPFVFGSGIQEAVDPQTGQKVELEVGANVAVLVPEPNAKMMYVAHSGESLDSVKGALDDLKNDMGSLGLAMLAPQKRTAETAEAKRLDKATSDSALAVSARALQDGIERALGFHARYLGGMESGGSVQINRDFEALLMEAPVMQAFAQLHNAGFPARPILEALQAGGRIRDDADLDELEMEWLMGTAARAEPEGPPPQAEPDVA